MVKDLGYVASIILGEMKELYDAGVRIYNFQDDNFYLPSKEKAFKRFQSLKKGLLDSNVEDIAIAIKARPDSITRESVEILDELGLFRVFLGVENASENGLRNLNRKSSTREAPQALDILNDFDIHIAYNLLMFEPETTMDDILLNLRFMERHIINPFNFCRAEVHVGTGLETKLKNEKLLHGNYFQPDYRIKDPESEAFHQIANYAFFDRNFSDDGLHYFTMQVDFTFQLLRRFYPDLLTESLLSEVKSLIKEANIDTYQCLTKIYDYVDSSDPGNQLAIMNFAKEMRGLVDNRGAPLHKWGENILNKLHQTFNLYQEDLTSNLVDDSSNLMVDNLFSLSEADIFGLTPTPITYKTFKTQLTRDIWERR